MTSEQNINQVDDKPSLDSGVSQPNILNQTTNIWDSLALGINPFYRKPRVSPYVILVENQDTPSHYYVLKNTRQKTYMRLSPEEFRWFSRMDGNVTVEELVFEHFLAEHALIPNRILHLVEQLYHHHMLDEAPVAVWSQVKMSINQRSWLYRLSSPARAFLTQKLYIPGFDKLVSGLYRSVGWLFFTKPVKILSLMISVLGGLAYIKVLNDSQYNFLGSNLGVGLASLWIVTIFSLLVHELGHALTVKHYGCEVPRGGVMLFMGMPAAFVETTDIWLESKRARLCVTWNGPYTGLILGGAAALGIYFFPSATWCNLFFKFCGIAYLTIFMDINPLLKLDGYYLLSDSLNITSIREKSLFFIRRQLFQRLRHRAKLTHDEWIFTVFGLLSMAWTIYALYLAYFFWQTRLQTGLQVLLGMRYSVITRIFSILTIAGVASVGFLVFMGLIQTGKKMVLQYISRGGLERYGLLAVTGAGLALSLSAMIFLAFPGRALWISALFGLLASILAAQQVLIFNKAYWGSRRALVNLEILTAVGLAGLAECAQLLPGLLPYSEWLAGSSLVLLFVSGLGLLWPAVLRLSPGSLILGLVIGGIGYFSLGWFGREITTDFHQWGLASLAAVGSWCCLSLWGSARAPAIGLIYLGAMMFGITMFGLSLPYSLAGILLMAMGCLHLAHAKLPEPSSDILQDVSELTSEAIRSSVGVIIQRVIAQISFECGRLGVSNLCKQFNAAMHRRGENLSITPSQFKDERLQQRSMDELTYIYSMAFDELNRMVSRELGARMGALTFAFGIDLLPWQYREVVGELILNRLPWGLTVNQAVMDSREQRRKLLKRVPIFVNCDGRELDRIDRNLKTERFGTGEIVLRQGDVGDKFYIVKSGKAAIWQKYPDGIEEVVKKVGPGQYFGETALATLAPRNATVQAVTPLVLLSLCKKEFDLLVKKHLTLTGQIQNSTRYSWLLRGMPLFDDFDSQQLHLLAERLQPEEYKAGDVITQENDPGDKFYIIESGQLIIARTKNGEMVEIVRRNPGEYVGEIALLQNRPRTASLIAAVDTTLLSLRAEYFWETVSGSDILDRTLALTSSRRLSSINLNGGH